MNEYTRQTSTGNTSVKIPNFNVGQNCSYDAEVKPPSTFEIKSRTHQAEGTFINVSAETVMFRISHTPREGYRNY